MWIEECEGVSASRKHLVFAYYVTGHGFGHATRVVEEEVKMRIEECEGVSASILQDKNICYEGQKTGRPSLSPPVQEYK